MDYAYGNQNRIWSTSNGVAGDNRRLATPGNLSVRTAASGQITARANSGGRPEGNGASSGIGGKQSSIHAYNSNLVGVQSKFRRKYYHKTLLISLILLIIILLITIIVISLKHKSSSHICQSKECIRTAASLIYSMDEQTDPCQDFYKFTCGNWANDHPKSDAATSNDWFHETQSKIMRELRQFLQANVSELEPVAVGKAKNMYRSCMKTDVLEKLDLEPLVNILHELKLPILPGGLNLTLTPEQIEKHGGNEDFDWLQSLVLIKRSLGMDLIVGFDIFPDPINRTINRIAFGTPETDSALPFNNDDMHQLLRKIRRKMISNQPDNDDMDDREEGEEESAKHTTAGLSAYVAYVKKMLEVYVLYLNPEANLDDVESSAGEMAVQAVKFAKRLYELKDEAENSTKNSKNPIDDIIYISVADLQNETDKLIAPKTMPLVEPYLQTIMKDINHTKPFTTNGLEIITSKADIFYLQSIAEFLMDEPPANVEFYIWLSVVEELALHTTSELRLLHTEYMRVLVGTEGSGPRSLYCVHGVNSLMGMAVSYALVDEQFTRHKLPMVHRMLGHIRRSFEQLVRSTSWMDELTKRETLQKSAGMKSFIGFPEWISNATVLDEHYAGVRVNVSTHLENMLGVLRWQMYEKLSNLHNTEPFGWATSPSNVNAFHTFQSNTITIPIAILQYPFYDLGLEALNYGSVGAILGHELTHGFDDSGRMFDKNGNMLQWWSNETIKEYINRTECFVDQYSHYYLDDIGEYIDGELTLGENIADNGGMREAFHAYRLYTKDVGKERHRLPGLEQYTHEQLFFIAFGNLWCETYTPAASRYALEDSHCPGKVRLKGVLSNSQEFADTFKCPRGSGMNPMDKKCRIW